MLSALIICTDNYNANKENESFISSLKQTDFSYITHAYLKLVYLVYNTCLFETSPSDFHKLVVTLLRLKFESLLPKVISYRTYKHFNKEKVKDLFPSYPNELEMSDLSVFKMTISNALTFSVPWTYIYVCMCLCQQPRYVCFSNHRHIYTSRICFARNHTVLLAGTKDVYIGHT